MIKAYTRTLKNCVAFSGRTKRSEFWLFVLAQSLVLVIELILVHINDAAGMLLTLYLLGTLIPTLAATVRRLHDTKGSHGGYLGSWRCSGSLRAGGSGPSVRGDRSNAARAETTVTYLAVVAHSAD